MLANNQIDVAGYKVWCPLGKCLSNDKKGLMKEHVMKSAAFKPSKCNEAGRHGSQALQNHLTKHQQHCRHQRALFLRFYVLEGEDAMVLHEPVDEYRHNNVGVHMFIDKIKVCHAPCHSARNCVLQFQHMVAGEEEMGKQKTQGHKARESIEWNFVSLLLKCHSILGLNVYNMQDTVEQLKAVIRVMRELSPEEYGEHTKKIITAAN